MCEPLLSEGDRWRYEMGTDMEHKGNKIPNSYSVSSRNLCFTIYRLFVFYFRSLWLDGTFSETVAQVSW